MARIDFGPRQEPISREKLERVLAWSPRRMKVGGPDWRSPLHPPAGIGKDWTLVFPFCETLRNAFEHGCAAETIGLRLGNGRCWTYLKGTIGKQESELVEVTDWLRKVGRYVAIRDALTISFALDYDRENGNPDSPQTTVGLLRSRAKPYDRPQTADVLKAADELAELLVLFLEEMNCYRSVDAVVAMPPSRTDKPFDLPTHLVARVAQSRGIDDLSSGLRTVRSRPQMKDVPIERKLDTLIGTVEADADVFSGRSVLLIDDLYQSGASANVAAMELLAAGARRILGLFCEKTCRNDDNVR